MLIDTHCHLDAAEFNLNRDFYVSEAMDCGVNHFVIPLVKVQNFQQSILLSNRYNCSLAFGLHPLLIDEYREEDLINLENTLRQYRPIAIGEIGLDGLDKRFNLDRQELLFAAQLHLARKLDLPVLIHANHAVDRVLKYLRQIPLCGGIIHAFNGSEQQAKEFLKLGFRLGFGSALSYENALRIRRLAANLPEEALLLETDAPYMSPAWAQKEINNPANLVKFAKIMARLRQQTFAEICQITSRNACDVLRMSL